MKHAEVQELLAEGHSHHYLNAPHPKWESPYVDEVDFHLETCPDCSRVLIRLLRAGLWRRPGPLHWMRVRRKVNQIHHWVNLAAQGPIAEEAPIVRVANTVIQQAIKEHAAEIELIVESSDKPLREPPFGPPAPSPPAKPGPPDLIQSLKRDIMEYGAAGEEDGPRSRLRVRVSYLVGGTWFDVMTMPACIAPPLWVRFKSMANLLVSIENEPQPGTIPIRYENRNYVVHVSTRPDDHGETLLLAIAPE